MDRDQEKFYEAEEPTTQTEAQPAQNQEIDDMSYFIELLKHLRTVLESGKRVPLMGGKALIDADMCLMIVEDLESNLPDAVQYGMQMYSERTRIMGDAEQTAINRVSSAEMRANAVLENARKDAQQLVDDAEAEAKAIVADAEDRAGRLVDENEIVRQAREEARIIKNDARVEASETRLKATHDAYQLLSGVEDELAEAVKTLRHRRQELGDEAE